MQPDLDRLLDMLEPVLDAQGAELDAAVERAARELRESGLVARPAPDRSVVVAGLMAYATTARAQGYDPAGLQEEIEPALRALMGEDRAATLLAEWNAMGR